MITQVISRRYAHALFLSTREKGLIDLAYEQFNDLNNLLVADASLMNFLKAPQVLEESKISLIRNVFKERLENLFVEFVVVLIEKGRIGYLSNIIKEFNYLVETEKGIGRVTVLTARKISESQREALTAKLVKKTGLKIFLEEKVDPSIIGGMIVKMYDQIIDGSVEYALKMVQDRLEKVRVH